MKKWYNVSISAEGETSGWIDLTEEEAKAVEYATNIDNWEKLKPESWSGYFFIDINHPKDKLGRND